jgi:hypothetical protein
MITANSYFTFAISQPERNSTACWKTIVPKYIFLFHVDARIHPAIDTFRFKINFVVVDIAVE